MTATTASARLALVVLLMTAVAGCRLALPVCERAEQCAAGELCVNGSCVTAARDGGGDVRVGGDSGVGGASDAAEDSRGDAALGSPSDGALSDLPGEGPVADAAPAADAAPVADAASVADAAPVADAASISDAGSTSDDAASVPDAAPVRDAAPGIDAGDAREAGAPDAPGVPELIPALSSCTGYQHNPTACNTGSPNWGISGLAYSRDGRLMASGADDGRVVLWTVTPGGLVRDGRALDVRGRSFNAFDPTGTLLASGDEAGKLQVHDLSRGQVYATIEGHAVRVVQVAFVAGGSRVISLDQSGEIIVWVVATKLIAANQALSSSTGVLAVDPRGTDASQWVAFGLDTGDVHLVDVSAGSWSHLSFTAGQSAILGLAFSPDGTRLATGAENGEVALWDVTNKAAVSRIGAPVSPPATVQTRRLQNAWEVAFTSGGRYLFVASSDGWESAVRTYDLSARSLFQELTLTPVPYRMAIAPDSSSLVIGLDVCGRIEFCSAPGQ